MTEESHNCFLTFPRCQFADRRMGTTRLHRSESRAVAGSPSLTCFGVGTEYGNGQGSRGHSRRRYPLRGVKDVAPYEAPAGARPFSLKVFEGAGTFFKKFPHTPRQKVFTSPPSTFSKKEPLCHNKSEP